MQKIPRGYFILAVLASTLCFPCVLVWAIWDKDHIERQDPARQFQGPPRRLPRRRHTLTIPSKTRNQSKSFLLGKLPLEVRQLIWYECVGGNVFHLNVQRGQRRSMRCTSERQDKCDGGAFGRKCHFPDSSLGKYDGLAILRTCRKVYSETVSILYSHNTFVFNRPNSIQFLPMLFLPHRLDTIRTLRFVWLYDGASPPLEPAEFPGHKYYQDKIEVWKTIWRNISEMQALRNLHITLKIGNPVTWQDMSPENATIVVEPIKAVTRPKAFELVVPDSIGAHRSPWTTLPCTIKIVPHETQSKFWLG